MALERIHLRKLLKIFFLDARKQRSAVRKDIWEDAAKAAGGVGAGGDFYGPFWADARSHVFGTADLHESVKQRIAANPRRSRLYQALRDGFLLWWSRRRRWTNEPFLLGQSLKKHFSFPNLNAVVKIDSVLSAKDALAAERFIYPYFAEEPALSEHAARLGLWLLTSAFPTVTPTEIRILDVMRGQTFSLDRNPLHGDEEADFHQRYVTLLQLRDELKKEDD